LASAAGCAADKAAVARHENIIQRMLFTHLRGQTKEASIIMFFNNQEEIFDSIDSRRGLIRCHFSGGVGAMPKCAKSFRLASTVWLLSLGDALTANAAELLQLPPAANIPIQRYGERYKLCLSWNDGCVTCTREACSNIGIACQPKKIICTESRKKPEK
jgi:hypothetical protein